MRCPPGRSADMGNRVPSQVAALQPRIPKTDLPANFCIQRFGYAVQDVLVATVEYCSI
jgi:hypothetical protein